MSDVESAEGLILFAPAASAIVCDNRSDENNKCLLVDVMVLVNLNASRRGIVLALVYQSCWIRRDGIVNKYIHVIFSGEQCADIAVEGKVWPVSV